MEVTAVRAEPLGSEVVLHFDSGVTAVVTEAAVDLLRDIDEGEPAAAASRPPLLTARLNPRTQVRDGDRIGLCVDAERLYFFDPETERSLL